MKLANYLRLVPVFGRCLWRLPFRHLVYMAKLLRYENPHHLNGKIYVNSFFPAYPSGAFDKLFETIFNGWRVPFSTYFAVTDQCPYKCPHCSYGKHVKGSLDTQKAIEVIEQIKSIGTITIGFTGGEPLVRDDIVELVESVGNDTASVMFSTGYNLTAETAKKLFDAGLDCMTIGIESDDPEEHDRIRGVSGSFETAINAIRLSLDAGLYTAISTIASRDKLDSGMLERLAEFANVAGVHEFRILEPIPTGSLSERDEEILTADESKQIAAFHKRWNRRGKGASVTSFAHLESDETFGCGAGFHHLFVDAVGNVCPCDLTPLKLGNVLEEPLYDIWIRMSKWFDMPRCGCLMKELCDKSGVMHKEGELPICVERSEQLCEEFKRKDKLPVVFANLFARRKPSNPPSNRRQSEKPPHK
ncbi:MAG: radical SAM protein [Planctomycetes bacterium]|nr:radical SAM protein [Planctomycetota bacterium]